MAVATADRGKLREVEGKLSEKRDELSEAYATRDKTRAAVMSADGLPDRESEEFKAAQVAVSKVTELRDEIDALTATQIDLLQMFGEEPGSDIEAPRQVEEGMEDVGWNASPLFTPEIQAELATWSATAGKRGTLKLGEVAPRDAMATGTDVAITANMRRGPYRGILPQLRRRIRILDLLPTGTMTGNTIPYTVESGSFTTATEVAEGALKPEAALTLTDASASAATIAHWLKIQKQSLSDWPAMRSIIDSRLRYGLLRRLEAEVLAGDGTGANMTGILNTSGIGTVTYTSGASVSDQVLSAITNIYLAEGEASGVVIHPTDWQRALKMKAQYPASGTPTVGSLEYIGGGPFGSTPETIWGIPMIPTAAIPQGTALVGDWDLGALLLIREGVQVLFSDSDEDDFRRNRVTLLAEMRAAFPVFRPAAFCTAGLGLAAS